MLSIYREGEKFLWILFERDECSIDWIDLRVSGNRYVLNLKGTLSYS